MDVQVSANHRAEDVEGLPVAELVEFVLGKEGCPFNTEVSVSFVDDEQMASLNTAYRGKEGPTDVLSFECDALEDALDDGPLVLGDIVVAVDVVERQTADFGTTFEGELSLLLVHGALHLCGHDHVDDDEAREMEAREVELLGEWAALRGLSMDVFGQLNGASWVRGDH